MRWKGREGSGEFGQDVSMLAAVIGWRRCFTLKEERHFLSLWNVRLVVVSGEVIVDEVLGLSRCQAMNTSDVDIE